MRSEKLLTRREFINGVSALAVASALLPEAMRGGTVSAEEFIVAGGWVLKRSETA